MEVWFLWKLHLTTTAKNHISWIMEFFVINNLIRYLKQGNCITPKKLRKYTLWNHFSDIVCQTICFRDLLLFFVIDSFNTRHMHKRLHLILVGILGSGFLYHYSLWKKKLSFDKYRGFKKRGCRVFRFFIKFSNINCAFNQKSLFKETSISLKKANLISPN